MARLSRSEISHKRGRLQLAPAEKAIPLLAHRRDILRRRRRVAQCRPNLPHAHPQHGVGDVRVPPHLPPQLGFRHQPAGVLDQIAQHRHGPRTQGHDLRPPPQPAVRHI